MSKEKRTGDKRHRLRLIIGALLITAGVSLVLFPYFTNLYSRHIARSGDVESIDKEPVTEEEGTPAISPTEEELKLKEDEPLPEELIPGKEGVLQIPALDLEVRVVYGVEPEDLRKAPGFYPQSQYPGQGNVSIAGHRTTYGAWFRHLDQLENGDKLLLKYDGKEYTFHLEDVFAIHNRDWSVIEPTEKPALTLTTCHPPGWATERLVARAYLAEDDNQSQGP